MIQLKLICGEEELDLADRTVWVPMPHGEGIVEEGDTTSISFFLVEDSNRKEEIPKVLHRLEWFNARAVEHARTGRGYPVRLGMKTGDGNDHDTVFGRGWVYKTLRGRDMHEEPAIWTELPEDWAEQINYAYMDSVMVNFRSAPVLDSAHGGMIYPWMPLNRTWVGQAQGAIRTEEHGGLILEKSATNKIPNSHYQNEADVDNGWTVSNATLTRTEQTDKEFIYYGYWSILLEEDGTAVRQWKVSINVGNTNKHSLQCYVKRKDSAAVTSADCVLYYNGVLSTTFESVGDGWYRAYSENFAGVNGAVDCGIEVKLGKEVYVDAFQLEEKEYCTTVAYGDMGRGYTFSGSDHTSTSVRAAAGIYYRNADGVTPRARPRDQGTALFVWRATHDVGNMPDDAYFLREATSGFRVFYKDSEADFRINDGTQVATTAGASFSKDDEVYVFGVWGPSGMSIHAYDNTGTTIATAGTSAIFAAPAPDDTFWVGSDNTPANQCGTLLELQIWAEELTTTEMSDRAKYGRGAGELPYLWSQTGTGTILNHDDTGANHDNWVEFGNAPGDFDCGLTLFVKNNQANAGRYLYIGQKRGAVGRADLPWTKHLVGQHWTPTLEAESANDHTTLDGDSSVVVDAAASGGNKVRTTPSNTNAVTRGQIRVCDEPEKLWPFIDRYLIMPVTYTGDTSHFEIDLRCTTGAHSGSWTPQVMCDAGSQWRPTDPFKLTLNIPSMELDEEGAQELRPGDWDDSADDDYCSLDYRVQAAAASGTLDCDFFVLFPAGFCGWVELDSDDYWAQNYYLMVDSCEAVRAFFTYDHDWERPEAGNDWEGSYFTLPSRDPSRMVFVLRVTSDPYPIDPADGMVIEAKVQPRYKTLR